MIAQNPLPNNPRVVAVTTTLPRPTGPVDTAAHLAELGTAIAPGPALHLRPRDQRGIHRLPHGLLPGLALALLGLALLIAPVAAATRAQGYVMHADYGTGDLLAAVVMDAPSTRQARLAFDAMDEWALEDQFDVTILDGREFTRSEARNLGVDEFRSYFFTEGLAAAGMLNIARDGETVFLILYRTPDEGDFDAAFDYQERVFEDGIDARAPRGFIEYEREETVPAFETSSL